jgi:acyl dehydratase
VDGVEELRRLAGEFTSTSDWFQVNQRLIDDFAELAQDRQWIHIDTARAAKESPFQATVAHGFLTVSLLSQLFHQAVDLRCGQKLTVNYGFNRLRFPAPVRAGSHIRLHASLDAAREVAGGVETTWGLTVEVAGSEKPALAAEWLLRLYL